MAGRAAFLAPQGQDKAGFAAGRGGKPHDLAIKAGQIRTLLAACVRHGKWVAAMNRSSADIRYAQISPRQVLDLVVPDATTPAPLVVFIHGGAFRMGDKSDCLRERQALVDAGFAVASLNYRYATEVIWPAQLDDLRAAIGFLRTHADRFGFDATRIASFGPSAGGHLSASVRIALSATSETWLAASIVWFPPVDFPTMDADIEATGVARATGRNDAPDSPESVLIGSCVADHPDLARSAGPIAQLGLLPTGAKLPAFLIMHGALDPYIAAAQAAKAAHSHCCPRHLTPA